MLSRDPDLKERQARHLVLCWQRLANGMPRLRLAEVALRLEVSEADLLAASALHQGSDALPNRVHVSSLGNSISLLSRLGEVGPLLIASENPNGDLRHLVKVSAAKSCHDGLILAGDGLIVTLRYRDLGALFLVHEQGGCACGQRTSIQLFDRDGRAAVRFYRTRDTDEHAFTTLTNDHCGSWLIDRVHEVIVTQEPADGEVVAHIPAAKLNALLVGLAKTNLALDVTLNTAVGAHSVVGQLRQARFEGRHHIMSFAYGCAGIQHDGLGDAQVVRHGPTVVLRIRDTLGEQVASISPSDEVAGRLMWQRLDFLK